MTTIHLDPILQRKAEILRRTNLFSSNYGESVQHLDKKNIFLVLAGLKPTGFVASGHMEPVPSEPNNRVMRPDNEEKVKELLTNLGLEFRLDYDEHSLGAEISLLKELLEKERPTHKEVGLLYGYPETAVEAFVNGNSLDREEQSKILKKYGIDETLCWFKLSKDHYKDELKVIKKWQDILEAYGLLSFS